MKLIEMPTWHFTWSRWRACNIFEKFKAPWKEEFIIQYKRIIKQYAIGYIKSEKLWVRPKESCYAVMFFIDGFHSWTHVSKKEFEEVFYEKS